ncbi:MAG: NAD-dependent epimerase/dehydratase family protein [Streptosporangiales bacterium]|nr:NAD-dependent epimerase/dehydratase family protein [Streptosporangiales bacterium]
MDPVRAYSLLVVGGCGWLGSLVLPHLAQDHDVTVLDLRPPSLPVSGVAYHEGDVRDFDLVTGLAFGADSLVYLATGAQDGWGTPHTIRQHFDAGVTGLHLALTAAHGAGVSHAVYASSMSVHRRTVAGTDRPATGDQLARFPDESAQPDARDFYGLAKRLGEEVCRAASDEWGMDTVCLRLSLPTPDHEWPRRGTIVEQLVSTAASDVASAVEAAVRYRGHGFDAFAISGDSAGRVMNLDRAKRLLGWTPRPR